MTLQGVDICVNRIHCGFHLKEGDLDLSLLYAVREDGGWKVQAVSDLL